LWGATAARRGWFLVFFRSFRRWANAEGIPDQDGGDTPRSDRAIRIALQHFSKRLFAFFPPERMQHRHSALELRLDLGIAGSGETYLAEFFLGVRSRHKQERQHV